jgi:hypothetical protein
MNIQTPHSLTSLFVRIRNVLLRDLVQLLRHNDSGGQMAAGANVY